jgi:hypothetical protein
MITLGTLSESLLVQYRRDVVNILPFDVRNAAGMQLLLSVSFVRSFVHSPCKNLRVSAPLRTHEGAKEELGYHESSDMHSRANLTCSKELFERRTGFMTVLKHRREMVLWKVTLVANIWIGSDRAQ